MNNKLIVDLILIRVYPLYIAKAKKKTYRRTKEEVDGFIRWLTGYN